MRLFITTRQAVARAIALALAPRGSSPERFSDHFQVTYADGTVDWLTWCGGHLLEPVAPEVYDSRYRKWRLEDLPIIPVKWQVLEAGDPRQSWREGLVAQLAFIRKALKHASLIVHAGDPDREGQWLIDEVVAYLQYGGPVQRLLLKNLNRRSLRESLKKFESAPPDNSDFRSLSISAQSRSRADWLYGINMTRAYTLLGRHAGYQEVLSVGRVQTPLLALVVRRDESIENFIPGYEYQLEAKFRKGEEFCLACYQSNDEIPAENGKAFLERLKEKLYGKTATLRERDRQHHFQGPPLLLDLSELQIQCAERFGYSGVEVLNIARCLYEEHHLISYPMTDCRYAPEKYRQEAGPVLETLWVNFSNEENNLKSSLKQVDIWRQSPVWDNNKLTLHHGIIPVAHEMDVKKLTEQERHVYEWIVRYYIAQFLPDTESLEDKLSFDMEGYRFDISKQFVAEQGWKQAIPDINNETKMVPSILPAWSTGEKIYCEDLEIRQRKSRPLSRFTEASLMAAMKQISPFVENEKIREQLHSYDGIGTEATRAYMVDTLFRRGYLIRGNKSIYSSGTGRNLIHALPAEAVSVDMTAIWEKQLSQMMSMPAIEAEKLAQKFMTEVEARLKDFICQARKQKNIPMTSPEEILGMDHEHKHHCPQCHSVLRLREGRYGSFWGCSAYPACHATVPDCVDAGGHHQPDYRKYSTDSEALHRPVLQGDADPATGISCPHCGSLLKKRRGKHGFFMGCSAYPACGYTTRRVKAS